MAAPDHPPRATQEQESGTTRERHGLHRVAADLGRDVQRRPGGLGQAVEVLLESAACARQQLLARLRPPSGQRLLARLRRQRLTVASTCRSDRAGGGGVASLRRRSSAHHLPRWRRHWRSRNALVSSAMAIDSRGTRPRSAPPGRTRAHGDHAVTPIQVASPTVERDGQGALGVERHRAQDGAHDGAHRRDPDEQPQARSPGARLHDEGRARPSTQRARHEAHEGRQQRRLDAACGASSDRAALTALSRSTLLANSSHSSSVTTMRGRPGPARTRPSAAREVERDGHDEQR